MDLSMNFKEAEKVYQRSAYDAGNAKLQLEMAKYNQHKLAVGFTEKANELINGHSQREVFKEDGTSETCEFLQFVYRSEEAENAFAHKYVGIIKDEEGDVFPVVIGSINILSEFIDLWKEGGPGLTFEAISELVNGTQIPIGRMLDTFFSD